MAEPSGRSKARSGGGGAAAYLARTLQMNPLYEADDVIALRSRALRLRSDPEPQATAEDLSKRRAKVLEALEAIRAECWTAAPDELLAKLGGLDLAGLPDVQAAAKRLEIVARNRTKLPELTANKNFDGDFFSCLKQVLAASPRETAVLREQVLASFRSGKLRKRGRKMIKLVEKQLPELYELEADWFASLMRQHATVQADPGGATTETGFADSAESSGIPSWVWWIAIVVIVRIVFAALRSSGN